MYAMPKMTKFRLRLTFERRSLREGYHENNKLAKNDEFDKISPKVNI